MVDELEAYDPSKYYESDMQSLSVMIPDLEKGNFVDADCDLFATCMRSVERARAIELLLKVSKCCPNVGFPFVELGRLYLADNRVEDATAMFEKAVAINFDHARYSYQDLADYFESHGNVSKASEYREKEAHAEANYYLGWDYDYDDDGAVVQVPRVDEFAGPPLEDVPESDFYVALKDLLDRPQNDPVCQKMLNKLGKPDAVEGIGPFTINHWRKFGLSIHHTKKFDRVCGLTFHLNTGGVKAKQIKPFVGAVLGGIRVGDDPNTVSRRMYLKPIEISEKGDNKPTWNGMRVCEKQNDHCEKYWYSPLFLNFIFEGEGGPLVLLEMTMKQYLTL